MKRISVNLTDPQIESFTQLAEASDIGFAEMLRRALDDFLVRERQQNTAILRKQQPRGSHDTGDHSAPSTPLASS